LAAALSDEFRNPVGQPHAFEEIVLVPSGGGRFEVELDGELIYSKKATGRHTSPEEVITLLKDELSRR
jgi:selenoprotein W-related protein